jgi:type IV pilus assembly protein PilE
MKPMPRAACSGFSLIELLTVVLIIGLLAAVAWPSYQSHLMRSQRAQAAVALLQAQQFMERHYSVHGSYLSASGARLELPLALQAVQADSQVVYQIKIDTADALSYRLLASPQGPMQADDCGALSLDHTGLKGRSGSAASVAQCWR